MISRVGEHMGQLRLFIECTQTYFNGGNSGIQRVARNIANHTRNLSHPECEVIPIIWAGYGFAKIGCELTCHEHPVVKLRNWILGKRRTHLRLSPLSGALPSNYPTPQTHQRSTTSQFLLDASMRAAKTFSYTFERLAYCIARIHFGAKIEFREGDTVLLIDATWGFPRMIDSLYRAQKEHGIKVAPMLHDLFPLTHPETCDDMTVHVFRRWFHQSVPEADFFITNSKATGNSFARYLEQHPELRTAPVVLDSFRLGAELDLLKTIDASPITALPIFPGAGRSVLSIGTIEPRKNHGLILDAFDLMRSHGTDVSLLLIGKVGWKSDAIMKRLRDHPDWNTRLFHLADASDALLAEAIERSDCIVCASIAEGFGLPVVESLMRGKEVFASDIEAFREIAGDRCHFFSPDNPGELSTKLLRWFESGAPRLRSDPDCSFRWPNWRSSSEELIDKALGLIRRVDNRGFPPDEIERHPMASGKPG